MSHSEDDWNLKDGDFRTFEKLKEDVKNPNFMQDINEFYKLDLMQGTQYVKQPSYDPDEQIIC
jgi:hypothetical protein